MNYIRIYEVLNISELALIKLSFNKEQINFRVQHENTLQLSSAYAMGNSGAIVEVLESDVPLAVEVLKEVGINLESGGAANRFEFLNAIDKLIDQIPVLNSLEGSTRYFFFFVPLAMLVFLGLIALMS